VKTVKNGQQVKRVSNSAAQDLVDNYGWSYCPKFEMLPDGERRRRKMGKSYRAKK